MKDRYSAFEASPLKILPLLAFIVAIFVGFTKCEAQSVTGKWKRTFTKIFITDKTTGKQTPASPEMQKSFDDQANAYNETLELMPDNTYISTISTAADEQPKVHTGTYSLSGKELDMKIPLVHNEKTTITIQSIDSKTMVWNLVFMGKLTEITYTKME
jgi:hypothetical protein